MPINVFPYNGMSILAARSFWCEQSWFAQQEISLSNQQQQGFLEYADDIAREAAETILDRTRAAPVAALPQGRGTLRRRWRANAPLPVV